MAPGASKQFGHPMFEYKVFALKKVLAILLGLFGVPQLSGARGIAPPLPHRRYGPGYCSQNAASSWSNHSESRTYDPRHNTTATKFPTRLGSLYYWCNEFNGICGESPHHTGSMRRVWTLRHQARAQHSAVEWTTVEVASQPVA